LRYPYTASILIENISTIVMRIPKKLFKVLLIPGMCLLFIATASAQEVTRGFATDDSALRPGMMVAISDSSAVDLQKVERASTEHTDKIFGVAVNAGEEDVLTVGSARDQVYVKSSGEAPAYVSDINGTVVKGDTLGISPLKGILMKADANTPALGIALEDFSGGNPEKQTVSTGTGDREVRVALVGVSLDTGLADNLAGLTDEENALQKIARSITGQRVGEVQVFVALIIFLVVMVSEGSIIYGAVSAAIAAVGRNPLAVKHIRIELMRLIIFAVIVLLVGLGAIYGVLRL
jgi:hypothetical protein